MLADLRLELRFRNNVLWHAIFDTAPTVAEFCRLHKLPQSQVGAYLNLTKSPYRGGLERDLVPLAQRLCEVTGIGRADLFPPDLYTGVLRTRHVAEIPASRLVPLMMARGPLALPPTQEHDVFSHERRDILREMLTTLTPRERQAVSMKFGLTDDGEERSYADVGEQLALTGARVSQLVNSAIRKFRHPNMRKCLQAASGRRIASL